MTTRRKGAARAALTVAMGLFGLAAQAADLQYVAPVYVTEGDASSGIDHWVTNSVPTGYATVASDTTTWGTTGATNWYVVAADVTISSRITCNGAVNLLLRPGAKLTASAGITVSGTGNSLAVYGEPDGAGALVAKGGENRAGIGGEVLGAGSNITINGGSVVSNGGNGGAGIGGGNQGTGSNIAINGGTVVASAPAYSGAGIGGGLSGVGSDIAINGGMVYVSSLNNCLVGGDSDASANVTIASSANVFFDLTGDGAGIAARPTFQGLVLLTPETPEGRYLVNGIANWTGATTVALTNAVTGATGSLAVNGSGLMYANRWLTLPITTAGELKLAPYTLTTINAPTAIEHATAKVYTNDVEVTVGTGGLVVPQGVGIVAKVVYTADALYAFNGNATVTKTINLNVNPATWTAPDAPTFIGTVISAPTDTPEHTTAKVYTNGVEVTVGTDGLPVAKGCVATVVYTADESYSFSGVSVITNTVDTSVNPATLPDAPTAPTLPPQYVAPVYKTEGDPSSGIDHWVTNRVPAVYSTVAAGSTMWGTAGATSWYIVPSDVTISTRITCRGSVNLVLGDGATLTAAAGLQVEGSGSLAVYGPTADTGAFVVGGVGSNVGLSGSVVLSPRVNVLFDLTDGGEVPAFTGSVLLLPETAAERTLTSGVPQQTALTAFALINAATSSKGSASVGGEFVSFANSLFCLRFADGMLKIVGGSLITTPTLAYATVKIYTNGVEVTVGDAGIPVVKGTSATVVYTADEGYSFGGTGAAITNTVDTSVNPATLPDAPTAPTLTPQYVAPVYKTAGVASSGIDHWITNHVPAVYSTVAAGSTTWGTARATSWYIVPSDVTISSRITCNGTVNLLLCPGAKLTASEGITVSEDMWGNASALTIYGEPDGAGALEASGGSSCAGIGGYYDDGSGIVINGGTVTATGGSSGAGIGGGSSGVGSDITINGGTVTATGGGRAAGIGGGKNRAGSDITINGGMVTANGGYYAAGIGGGYCGAGNTIAINGGTVFVSAWVAYYDNNGFTGYVTPDFIGNGYKATASASGNTIGADARVFFNATGVYGNESDDEVVVEPIAPAPTTFEGFVFMTPGTQTVDRVLVGGIQESSVLSAIVLTNAVTGATANLAVNDAHVDFANNYLRLAAAEGNVTLTIDPRTLTVTQQPDAANDYTIAATTDGNDGILDYAWLKGEETSLGMGDLFGAIYEDISEYGAWNETSVSSYAAYEGDIILLIWTEASLPTGGVLHFTGPSTLVDDAALTGADAGTLTKGEGDTWTYMFKSIEYSASRANVSTLSLCATNGTERIPFAISNLTFEATTYSAADPVSSETKVDFTTLVSRLYAGGGYTVDGTKAVTAAGDMYFVWQASAFADGSVFTFTSESTNLVNSMGDEVGTLTRSGNLYTFVPKAYWGVYYFLDLVDGDGSQDFSISDLTCTYTETVNTAEGPTMTTFPSDKGVDGTTYICRVTYGHNGTTYTADSDAFTFGSAAPTRVQVGDEAYATVADGVCTITGKGAIWGAGDWTDGNPLAAYKGGITSIVIEDYITEIGEDAFYKFYAVTNVACGAGVTKVGKYAFGRCNSLLDLTFAGSPTLDEKSVKMHLAIVMEEGGTPKVTLIPDIGGLNLKLKGSNDLVNWYETTNEAEKAKTEDERYHFFKVVVE